MRGRRQGCRVIRLGLGGVVLALGLMLTAVLEARAGLPTDQLKGAIDRVVKTLDDPTLKGADRAMERRRAVRKVANDIFDFAEIARRSLARHWQPLTDQQHTEFVTLFADLLERSYISKIELYGGEKILYTSERMDGDLATVSTKIVTRNGTEVPIDYRLLKRGDRTQFNKIIQTGSYADLVQKLRVKQDGLTSEDQGQHKKTSPVKR